MRLPAIRVAPRFAWSKGAFAAVAGLTQSPPDAYRTASDLEARGFRVLAVAIGPPGALKLAGIIALSDPPRPDSALLITELRTLGVRAVMVTGDAPATAAIVAHMPANRLRSGKYIKTSQSIILYLFAYCLFFGLLAGVWAQSCISQARLPLRS